MQYVLNLHYLTNPKDFDFVNVDLKHKMADNVRFAAYHKIDVAKDVFIRQDY